MSGSTIELPQTSRDLSSWKPLFYIAAAYNIMAAAVALIAPRFHTASFFGPDTAFEGSVALLNTQAFWVSVLLFGLGYLMVARDPSKNHGIVLLAAVGKTYVFVIWAWHYAQGSMTAFALLGGVGDLIFAGTFAVFLWKVGNR
jgi:hypothetical protein